MKIDIKKILRLKLEIGMTIRTFCKRFLKFHMEGNWMSNIDSELGYKREPVTSFYSGCIIQAVCEWRIDLYKTLIKNKIIKGELNKFGRTPALSKWQEKKTNKILKECLKSVKW